MKKIVLLLLCLAGTVLRAQEIVQNIRGTVVDKETKSAIPGAIVAVKNASIYATTDGKGNFRLEKVPLGRHTIRVTYLGYLEMVIPNVIVNSGKETLLSVEMTEAVNKIEEVTVTATAKGDANNDMTSVSAKNFSMEEANRYAGSRGDPARMASNMAGVNGGDDSRNDIVIRGNSPAGLLWRVEGISIPNPNHFAVPGTTGGPVTVLNNKMFGSSDFLTGAFPAEYGNSNAGVFDIRFRNGNNERHELTGQIGALGIEAAAEGPISKKTGATYLATYRYSSLGLFQSLHLPIGTSAIPNYQDASFKLNFPTKKAGNFSVFGIGGTSNIFVKLSDKPIDEVELYGDSNRDQFLKSSMGVVGVTHSKSIRDRTLIKTTLAVTANQTVAKDDIFYRNPTTFLVDTVYPKMRYTFNYGKYCLNFNVTHKFNAKTSIKGGILADYMFFNLKDSNLVESVSKWDHRVNYVGNTLLLQPFMQMKYKPTDKLVFNVGLHAQYLTLNGSSSFEPRAGFRWNFANTQFLSFGYGLHSQMQPAFVYFHQIQDSTGKYQLSNKNLGFTRAQHFVIGYEKLFKNASHIIVELYYQNLYDVPVDTFSSSYSSLNQGNLFEPPYPHTLVNKGKGRNYGGEFTLEKYFDKSYFFLFTACLFKSLYTGSDGIERSTDYDQGYITNVLAGKEFKLGKSGRKILTISGKVTYEGGRRYSPADVAASATAGSLVEIDSLRNSKQFRDYFRWDMRIGYKVSTKHFTHEIAVDLVNILNTKNILGLTYSPDPKNPTADPIKQQYQLGFLPLFYYKFDF